MANDVSQFRITGDATTYRFNDSDAESRITAEASRAAGVEGTLAGLTTTAKGNLVAAINEVDYDAPPVASAYTTGATYAVGDYVRYNGTIYKCTNAISSAPANLNTSYWTAVMMADDVSALNSKTKLLLLSLSNVETDENGDIATGLLVQDATVIGATYVTPGYYYCVPIAIWNSTAGARMWCLRARTSAGGNPGAQTGLSVAVYYLPIGTT